MYVSNKKGARDGTVFESYINGNSVRSPNEVTYPMAINLTPVGDILTGVVAFIPNLVDLVVNLIPLSIAIAISGFIVGIFAAILTKL